MKRAALAGLLGALPACAATPAAFTDVFVTVRSVALEEPADAVIGDLGAHAAGAGVWAVIDRQASELRLHDPADGRLLGRPALAGEGPGELRRPSDVAIHDGVVWVADAGTAELVGFPVDGGALRSLAVPGGRAKRVVASRRGLLVGTTDPVEPRLSLIDPDNGAVIARAVTTDSATLAIPYWGGIIDHPAAVLGDDIVAAMNLPYPILRHAADGTMDPLGTPPASWRDARVPEFGEFAGIEGQRDLLPVYLQSFTTIERQDAIGDVLLVTHGGFSVWRLDATWHDVYT